MIAQDSYQGLFEEPQKEATGTMGEPEQKQTTDISREIKTVRDEDMNEDHKTINNSESEENTKNESNGLKNEEHKGDYIKKIGYASEENDITQFKELFPCEECGKSFKDRCDFKRHMLSHTGVKDFLCKVCAKPFGLKQNLERHVRTHSDIRPFLCNFCTKTFSQLTHLKEHEGKIHTGLSKLQKKKKKRWDCDKCGKNFHTLRRYERHMDGHAGKRACQCTTCGKFFSSKKAMEQHVDVVHLEKKNFGCTVCDSSFGRKSTLRVHYLTHSQELPFKCFVMSCHAGYKEKRNLTKHILKSHPQIKRTANN